MYCYLCCDSYAGVLDALCEDCRKVRYIIKLYGKTNVVEVLNKILLRTPEQQEHKMKTITK